MKLTKLKKEPRLKVTKVNQETDSRNFLLGTVLGHIKKNWVDIKSMTKKLPDLQTKDLGS